MSRRRGSRAEHLRQMLDQEVKLDMTPIIDVTFNLLVFFMCTLKFRTLEGKLETWLPSDRGLSAAVRPVPREDADLVLRVAESEASKPPLEREVVLARGGGGPVFGRILGIEPDPADPARIRPVLDPPDTLARVRGWLTEVRKRAPDIKARLDVSPRASHLHAILAQNLVLACGFPDISWSGIPASLARDLESGVLK